MGVYNGAKDTLERLALSWWRLETKPACLSIATSPYTVSGIVPPPSKNRSITPVAFYQQRTMALRLGDSNPPLKSTPPTIREKEKFWGSYLHRDWAFPVVPWSAPDGVTGT